MKEAYLTVAGRIRRELNELYAVMERTLAIWGEAKPVEEGDYHIDAVALNLHGFYAGLERILEIIATRVDQTVPAGGNWHQELLDQMSTDVPRVRPAVLSEATRKKLDAFRGFRHVVRNVYTHDFDPQQIGLLVERLPGTMDRVAEDLYAFANQLEDIAGEDA